MRRILSASAVLVATVSLVAPATAQQETGLEVSVFGSGNKPLQRLNNVPNLGFKNGFGGGVGLTYVLEKNIALRGDFNFVKSDVNVPATTCSPQPTCVIGPLGNGGALNSLSWSHFVAGADLVLRLPLSSVMPYFTTGAGIVKFKESGGRSATRMAGRFGAGIQIPMGDKLGGFVQANASAYDFDQRFCEYFTKVQVDVLLSAGVSIRLF